MKQDKEYIPQHISDRITQDLIDRLLRDDTYDNEEKMFNPHDLSGDRSINLEAGFKHGIKPAPPATKKLKPAAISMFEYEIMRQVGENIEVPNIIGTTHVKVDIPGLAGEHYVNTRLLQKLFREFLCETTFRPCKGGERFIAIFHVDTKLLIENCIRRK